MKHVEPISSTGQITLRTNLSSDGLIDLVYSTLPFETKNALETYFYSFCVSRVKQFLVAVEIIPRVLQR